MLSYDLVDTMQHKIRRSAFFQFFFHEAILKVPITILIDVMHKISFKTTTYHSHSPPHFSRTLPSSWDRCRRAVGRRPLDRRSMERRKDERSLRRVRNYFQNFIECLAHERISLFLELFPRLSGCIQCCNCFTIHEHDAQRNRRAQNYEKINSYASLTGVEHCVTNYTSKPHFECLGYQSKCCDTHSKGYKFQKFKFQKATNIRWFWEPQVIGNFSYFWPGLRPLWIRRGREWGREYSKNIYIERLFLKQRHASNRPPVHWLL